MNFMKKFLRQILFRFSMSRKIHSWRTAASNRLVWRGLVVHPKVTHLKKMISFVDLDQDEQKDFFNSIDVVIADCDGVLWNKQNIPGSGNVINKFREIGKKVFLVSNNSLIPIEAFRKKVKDANIEDFPNDNIIVPSTTVIKYLNSIKFRKRLYTLCSHSMFEELKRAGFHCDNGANLNPDDPISQRDLDPEVGAVIVDSDVRINYMSTSKAVHYLKKPDTLFIAGATDEWHALNPTVHVLGPGYFLNLISTASGRQPIVLGKPGKELGDILNKNCNITDSRRILFIGDSLYTDIAFAYKQGFRSFLVLSGLTNMENAEEGVKVETTCSDGQKILKIVKPEYYIKSLGSLESIIKKLNLSNASSNGWKSKDQDKINGSH